MQENDIFNSRFALHVKTDHLVILELYYQNSTKTEASFILGFSVSGSSDGKRGSSDPPAAVRGWLVSRGAERGEDRCSAEEGEGGDFSTVFFFGVCRSMGRFH